MKQAAFKSGFSLTEVLMAAGILLVGFLLIAGTFPVGVKLTAVATERTIGVIASEEAMAKIHLYGIDPNLLPYDRHVPFDGISIQQYWGLTGPQKSPFISNEAFANLRRTYGATFAQTYADEYFQAESLYPSTVFFDPSAAAGARIKTNLDDPQRYFWSALCRRLDQTSNEIQITIFVSRMAGQNVRYPRYNFNRVTGVPMTPATWSASNYPTPVPVMVQTITGSHIGFQQGIRWTYYFQKISVTSADKAKAMYIAKDAILLDDQYGRMMRVQDIRYPDPAIANDLGEITLIRAVDSDGNPATIIPADGDGLLIREYAAANTIYQRQVWVIPPALAPSVPASSSTPPKVVGRNPCVGVFQGQL
ncbi:MAG: hypothetical protein GX455_15445 [Phycisphaerae bacterium]|nr:hypothetical protein [Phycisphaerae bacterium]